MHIHFIQHEVFEAPGVYQDWALSRGYTIGFSKVFEYEALPSSIAAIDLLIILGGPQSPDTLLEDCPYFDAIAEMKLIRKAITAGKAVVGVCLGAQLIAAALGASHLPSPEKEIGVFPIALTEAGMLDEKVKHLGAFLPVGHWHNDMPGLPAGSKVLATSLGCPRQIISFANLVYGLQCHIEFTKELVEMLVEADGALFSHNRQFSFILEPDQLVSYDFMNMNNKLFGFLDSLTQAYPISLY
ncbi:glutamine amidotransferase-related protein [Niabella hibiscisoli]|uniref:glutamine amidotransferase-related protein n=1 Tax=Niabella hibiscisoli TaxID=1825928 RepID=UPI001F0D5528|nr:gamma-glutamyl-gamma-aminobutyrate hydrolase family protein [Niabella hibiscisoli]MCH5720078.1 gamma-glutamyl-gamma-aminobutyrate hydrolase family protein [Niabella hibiscisoli]